MSNHDITKTGDPNINAGASQFPFPADRFSRQTSSHFALKGQEAGFYSKTPFSFTWLTSFPFSSLIEARTLCSIGEPVHSVRKILVLHQTKSARAPFCTRLSLESLQPEPGCLWIHLLLAPNTICTITHKSLCTLCYCFFFMFFIYSHFNFFFFMTNLSLVLSFFFFFSINLVLLMSMTFQ